MTADPQGQHAVALTAEAIGIRKEWGWFLALGASRSSPTGGGFVFSATLASVVALGVLLLIAGTTQMAAAASWRVAGTGSSVHASTGSLYGVAGFLTLEHPLLAGEGLTLMRSRTIPACRAVPHRSRPDRKPPGPGLAPV